MKPHALSSANAHSVRSEKQSLVVFFLVAFSGVVPSRGAGISSDEAAAMAVVATATILAVMRRPELLGKVPVILGFLAFIGGFGALVHEDASAVLLGCLKSSPFLMGMIIAAAMPRTLRSSAIGMLGVATLIGGTIAAYLDLVGVDPALGAKSQEFEIGVRGTLSSLTMFWCLTAPLLIAFARRWRRGALIMAGVTLPYLLVGTAGIAQGRGQTLLVLLGAALVLGVTLKPFAIFMLVGATGLFYFLGDELPLPDLFSAFQQRVQGTDIRELDRLEHAVVAFRLLENADFTELLFGIPSSRVSAALGGIGIHNGYLATMVAGGLLAALPVWLLYAHLGGVLFQKSWRMDDDASIAGLAVTVVFLVNQLAGDAFGDWHSALYTGLAVGFGWSRVSVRSAPRNAGPLIETRSVGVVRDARQQGVV